MSLDLRIPMGLMFTLVGLIPHGVWICYARQCGALCQESGH